jgi:hypothetical protein
MSGCCGSDGCVGDCGADALSLVYYGRDIMGSVSWNCTAPGVGVFDESLAIELGLSEFGDKIMYSGSISNLCMCYI